MNKIVVILIMIILAGCQSAELEQSTGIESNQKESAPFDVHISVPKQVKVNELFTMNLELESLLEHTAEVTTGEPVFYYVILDAKGKALNPFVTRNDIGVVRPVTSNEKLTEQHTYRFKQSGTYEIYAVADFTFTSQGDEETQSLRLETEREQVIVKD